MKTKKINWKRFLGIVVLLSLLFSIFYSVFQLSVMPDDSSLARNNYSLILLECSLGIIVLFLPSWLEKKWDITFPNYIHVVYFLFLYCALYLGEFRSFYYMIPHWDTILHGFSGVMLGLFGFILVNILNKSEKVTVKLSPFFVALFAFSFAIAMGAIWEIYEFSGDSILGLNMQKYRLADGTILIGHEALVDTMKDIIIDTVGALVASIMGFLSLKKKKRV